MTKNLLKFCYIFFTLVIYSLFNSYIKAEYKSEIRDYVDISYTSHFSSFPVQKPRPLNFNQFGCYTDFSKPNIPPVDLMTSAYINESFYFTQHSNDNGDYCMGSPNITICPANAEVNLYSPTGGVCYIKNKKEIRLQVNTINQPYNGCYINKDLENQQNPGGYDIYGLINFYKIPPELKNGFDYISNLDSVTLYNKINNRYFSSIACGDGPAGALPHAEGKPVSLILNNIMMYNDVKKAALFYNITMWDNRIENRYNDKSTQTICNFPTSADGVTFYLANDNIPYYKLFAAEVGNNVYEYSYNILPRLEAIIKECDPNDSFANWKISGSYFGIENLNATDLGANFYNPKMTLVKKNNFNAFKPLFEVYCEANTDTAYLTNKDEVIIAVNNGCINKGIIGYVYSNKQENNKPLYRLWSAQYNNNFYTTNETEKNNALANGWFLVGNTSGGVVGYLPTSNLKNTKALYRLQNIKSLNKIDRTLVSELNKKGYLLTTGSYKEEGIIGYIYDITSNNIIGDYNNDGIINTSDLNLAKNMIFSLNKDLDIYDINFDKNANLKDLIETVQLVY